MRQSRGCDLIDYSHIAENAPAEQRAQAIAARKANRGVPYVLDISDRGGRPPGGFSAGTDWFVMKGQDTFGPKGPHIVPKEFYGRPDGDAAPASGTGPLGDACDSMARCCSSSEELTADPALRKLRNLNTRDDYERAVAEATESL